MLEFESLNFTQVLDIVDTYHRLVRSVDLANSWTQWQIAEFIDEASLTGEFEELILCEWSDYAYNEYGSDIDRANVKALAENFGEFVEIEDFDYAGKASINIGDLTKFENYGEFVDTVGYLIDIMDKLNSYPLIDEEIHSAMEMEAAVKAWDDYLAADIITELGKNHDDAQVWFDANESKLREFYYSFDGTWWSFETPTTIVNNNHSESLKYAVAQVMSQ